jgi:hypothetical protein
MAPMRVNGQHQSWLVPMFTFVVIVVGFGLIPSLLVVAFFEVRAARERELVEGGPARSHGAMLVQHRNLKVDDSAASSAPQLDMAWRYADRAPPD